MLNSYTNYDEIEVGLQKLEKTNKKKQTSDSKKHFLGGLII